MAEVELDEAGLDRDCARAHYEAALTTEKTLIWQQSKVDCWIRLNLAGLPVPSDLDDEIKNSDQFDTICERLVEESKDG